MTNDNIKPKYFWIYINPPYGAENKEWNKIGASLEEFCYKFTCLDDFSEGAIPTKFNFYIEKEIEIFKQNDIISTSTYLGIPKQSTLNIHINFEQFSKSDDKAKFKILANGILNLLLFWRNNLKIPKGLELNQITLNFERFLKENGKYIELEKTKNLYIKSENLFRISFQNHLLKDINEKEILIDIVELENYLNSKLNNISFGKSVKEIYFSYDFFDFYSPKTNEYKDEEKKYQYGRNKDLSIMEQFDTNFILYQSLTDQLEYFKKGILNAILRIKEMNRKPKDLDIEKLHFQLNKMLDEYIKTTTKNGYK